MKNKIIVISLIVLFIISLTNTIFAATGNVEFKLDKNKVKKGDIITFTIAATSNDGINGLETKINFDSNQLEIVSENVVDSSIWSNLGSSSSITVICNSTQTIKNADIYTMKFKVKDSVATGTKVAIESTDILLDTDSDNDSVVTIPAKKIEFEIFEENVENNNSNNTQNVQQNIEETPVSLPTITNDQTSKVNESAITNNSTPINNNSQQIQNNNSNSQSITTQNTNNTNNQRTTTTNKNNVQSSTTNNQGSTTQSAVASRSQNLASSRQDTTTAVSSLPNTGKTYLILFILFIAAIVSCIIFYQKKNIKLN